MSLRASEPAIMLGRFFVHLERKDRCELVNRYRRPWAALFNGHPVRGELSDGRPALVTFHQAAEPPGYWLAQIDGITNGFVGPIITSQWFDDIEAKAWLMGWLGDAWENAT